MYVYLYIYMYLYTYIYICGRYVHWFCFKHSQTIEVLELLCMHWVKIVYCHDWVNHLNKQIDFMYTKRLG